MKRRQFLAGAVTAAPALALTTAAGKVSAQTATPQARSVPPVPPNENQIPATGPALPGKGGSDFMVDVLKTLDIDYVATLPSSSVRGLHESIVNYGNNVKPELLTCLHEDVAVAMAHGYAKVARKPMAVMVHSTVGLQHCAMAIYNAYADRVPILLFSGNIVNGATRVPGVEWNHAAQDQAALVRDFTKWDDQPASLQSFGESLVRSYDLATTAPMAPVLLTVDGDMQEDPIEPAVEKRLSIPKIRIRSQPQGDSGAVREAAKMLVAAENPVIYVNRYGRTENAPSLLIELAETLNAPVVDAHGRMNFPNRHKLNHSARREAALAQADVLLALEPVDIWGLNSRVANVDFHPTRQSSRQPNLKMIHIGTEALLAKSNFAEHQRYAEVELAINGDAEATMPTLLEAVRALITPARKSELTARGDKLMQMSARLMDQARAEAVYAWDASPISSSRLCMELWDQIRHDDWMMPTETQFISDWPYRLWNIDKPYQTMGGSGAAGVGYNSPSALGAALANKPHGRLTVAIVGDGDFNMGPGFLWTAAHHKIPLLVIVHNNRAYHQELMFVHAIAARRDRDVTRGTIGTTIRDPNIDYAKIAQGYGLYAEGPIADPKDLGPALRRALDVVRKGEPALLDVISQPR